MFPWQRKELQKNAGTDIILSLANGDVNCNSIFRIYSTGGTYNPVTDEPVYQRVERGKVPDPRARFSMYQNPPVVDTGE